MASQVVSKGLEDVIAASTQLSYIDGREGRLVYRGYDMHDLAESSTFEETVYLLLYGGLPTRNQFDEFSKSLDAARELPKPILEMMRHCLPKTTGSMDALRTVVSGLSAHDPDANDSSPEANMRKAIRLVAQLGTIVACYDRIRNGKEIIPPKVGLSHAANFLYMLTGQVPDKKSERFFDICLILHADHGMNASTFAARVAASTLSDMHSAVTAAIGTLKGPLHGGANERVMEMLLEIGDIPKIDGYIGAALGAKKRIMGFGHRVYKTEDPRATHLRRMSKELGEVTGNTKWFEMSRKIEDLMWEEKKLKPNVDFYSASVYHSMGIPTDLFTPIFAVSRIAGWVAHVMEQYSDNRLIRPEAEYTGPMGLHYAPIDKR